MSYRQEFLGEARLDVRTILDAAPNEVPALLVAVREGRIDGGLYVGPCCCLIGTIAASKGVDPHSLDGDLAPDMWRPAEEFVLGIDEGDRPDNSEESRQLEAWILEWQADREATGA